MTNNTESKRTERIAGQLHEIREVRDRSGEVIARVTDRLRVEFRWSDVLQLAVGALVLGIPVAYTEEVWDLGQALSGARIALVALVSILILGFFVKTLFYAEHLLKEYRAEFFKRVVVAYTLTLLVAFLLLVLIDKGPLDDPLLALKRAVLIAFPGSLAATAVDYIK